MSDLISVLMPTFNVVNFVEDAVNSILSQTYKNIELIIVDDCSTDGTYEKLQLLAQNDNRIRLFRNEKNSKICKTLNKGLLEAKGSYIARMDGDDVCDPQRLEKMKRFLDFHQDIELVGSWINSIDEKGNILSTKRFLTESSSIKKNIYTQDCVLHIWLARKRIYDELNGYRELPFVEDYDFLLRGLNHGFNYANVPEYLYSVRTRTGNTGSANGLKQQKAKYFVRKLNKEEGRIGKEIFTEHMYLEAIRSTDDEEKKYRNAFHHLQIALESRKAPLKLVWYTALAFLENRYTRSHLIESTKMRMAIMQEKRN